MSKVIYASTFSIFLIVVLLLQKQFLLEDSKDEENPSKLKKSNVCVACLGLLQEDLREAVVTKACYHNKPLFYKPYILVIVSF